MRSEVEVRELLAETNRILMTSRTELRKATRAARSKAKPAPTEWTPELQAEFGTLDIYQFWLAAAARGAIICHGPQ